MTPVRVRHRVTGEEFEKLYDIGAEISVRDKYGERRLFHKDVLEEITPVEERELVNSAQIYIDVYGVLRVYFPKVKEHFPYPHHDLRFIDLDGRTVLQRRKV